MISDMHVAVLTDIHADSQALERVLEATECADIDEVWCLGDIVGLGGNEPALVIELVRERATVALAGNHDRWVTGGLPLDMLAMPAHRAELQWQLTRLSADQFEWLSGLPAYAERAGIELWHASAEDPLTAWIENQADAAAHLVRQRTPVGLVGHTHRPLIASAIGDGIRWDEQPSREQLDEHYRTVLNPGAVTRTHRWLELDTDSQLAFWHDA